MFMNINQLCRFFNIISSIVLVPHSHRDSLHHTATKQKGAVDHLGGGHSWERGDVRRWRRWRRGHRGLRHHRPQEPSCRWGAQVPSGRPARVHPAVVITETGPRPSQPHVPGHRWGNGRQRVYQTEGGRDGSGY